MFVGLTFTALRVIRLEGDQATGKDLTLYKKCTKDHCVLVNGLGTTETGLVCQFFMTHQTQGIHGAIPIGFPVEGMNVFIDNPNSEGVGEVCIKSPFLAKEYCGRPDLTQAAFTEEMDEILGSVKTYHTGDLGRFQGENEIGPLKIIGRAKFGVKIRGQWVDLAKIERLLCAVPGISDCVVHVFDPSSVTSLDNSSSEKLLVAYIIVSSPPSLSSLTQSLNQNSIPILPSFFVVLESFPLNFHGKVDKQSLPVPTYENCLKASVYVAPQDEGMMFISFPLIFLIQWSAVFALCFLQFFHLPLPLVLQTTSSFLAGIP